MYHVFTEVGCTVDELINGIQNMDNENLLRFFDIDASNPPADFNTSKGMLSVSQIEYIESLGVKVNQSDNPAPRGQVCQVSGPLFIFEESK